MYSICAIPHIKVIIRVRIVRCKPNLNIIGKVRWYEFQTAVSNIFLPIKVIVES
jgi:hypothetical protein